MLAMGLDHLEHLKALRCQTVALLAQLGCFVEIVHGWLLRRVSSAPSRTSANLFGSGDIVPTFIGSCQ
jgi:hypothetical protein